MPTPEPRTRRKSRRPTLALAVAAPGALLSSFMLASSSSVSTRPLSRELERLSLDIQECLPERAHARVEVCRLADRHVGKQAAHPRRYMRLEDLAVCPGRRLERAVDEAGHHLAQGGGVVLGLGLALYALDSQALQVATQPRQRALVEKAGQVVGRIGQQLAASQSNEQVEVLAPHALH